MKKRSAIKHAVYCVSHQMRRIKVCNLNNYVEIKLGIYGDRNEAHWFLLP